MLDIDAIVASATKLDIPAGVARALVDQMAAYNIDPTKTADIAQMAQDAAAVNARSFADGSGFRDAMVRVIRGAASFRIRIEEMFSAEEGDHA